MNPAECTREQDVLDAVAAGRWPDRSDEALRAHVAVCAICTDVVDVARAFRDDYDDAWRHARVPPSGRVWWRAEMRARQDAAQRAAQPITVVQGIAGACATGILVALITILWPRVAESVGLLAAVKTMFGAGGVVLAAVSSAMPPQIVLSLFVALGVGLVLTPVALYFVFSEK